MFSAFYRKPTSESALPAPSSPLLPRTKMVNEAAAAGGSADGGRVPSPHADPAVKNYVDARLAQCATSGRVNNIESTANAANQNAEIAMQSAAQAKDQARAAAEEAKKASDLAQRAVNDLVVVNSKLDQLLAVNKQPNSRQLQLLKMVKSAKHASKQFPDLFKNTSPQEHTVAQIMVGMTEFTEAEVREAVQLLWNYKEPNKRAADSEPDNSESSSDSEARKKHKGNDKGAKKGAGPSRSGRGPRTWTCWECKETFEDKPSLDKHTAAPPRNCMEKTLANAEKRAAAMKAKLGQK